MSFAEHTKRNWAITLFAAIFFAAIVTMIFLNNPHETIVVAACFAAALSLLFIGILGVWYLISSRKSQKKTA